MLTPVRKLLCLALPAACLATLVSVALTESWVRLAWDHHRGSPGFYLSDPELGLRLAPGYEGWFAGVPVKINRLGFRDRRDYAVEKAPGTFRILVLGDSVTFGHGATFETTYPFLLEQQLRAWRPEVRWQVWNLSVPGYNTRQELRYLREAAPRFEPDLAVIGFYPNDFTGNAEPSAPSWLRQVSSRVQRLMQRHFYSFELFKRVYLTARWTLFTDEIDRRRLEHLDTESALLTPASPSEGVTGYQQLTPVNYLSDEQVDTFVCTGTPRVDPGNAGELRERIRTRAPAIEPWLHAVSGLERFARERGLPLVFFINMAPGVCAEQDRFYDNGTLDDDDALLEVLETDSSAVSSARAFLHYRPSQMPAAGGHSLGNSNRVKAETLFAHLRTHVLPELLPATPGS